jgi:hypothetical protein
VIFGCECILPSPKTSFNSAFILLCKSGFIACFLEL